MTEPLSPQNPIATQLVERAISPHDTDLLGKLLYCAYKDTTDDEGASFEETLVETSETLEGKYGNVIWNASFVLEKDDLFVSAILTTDYAKANPLLAFAATHPDWQKRGLSAYLIQRTLSALYNAQIPLLHLVVTDDNWHAIRLYERLGFVRY